MATIPQPTLEPAKRGQIIEVDLTSTAGQESAIEANGSPVFRVKVTQPDEYDGGGYAKPLDGPVKGHTVFFREACRLA